ncbi:MAG: cryptochrome/photolyase family protein [Saprospiraceae bacterium]|nr:cryptochrome/photolyase family protein [Saprospiraceae bacterium]
MSRTLRLILGDQLNSSHSWLEDVDDDVLYVMMEIRQESEYVVHHIQKMVAFFLAMREFASSLRQAGHEVHYISIDDEEFEKSLPDLIKDLIKDRDIDRFEYQLPDEWRLDQQLSDLCEDLEVDTKVSDSEHFLTKRNDLKDFFGDKEFKMENFYREMRKKHDVLMDGGEPSMGRWNYDQENRKKLPSSAAPPDPRLFHRDVSEIVEQIESRDIKTIGRIDKEDFIWPVSREEGKEMLDHFIARCLPDFGRYQDAMTPDYWSIYHSRLSFLLNTKMLHPMEVIRQVEVAWNKDKNIDIAQAEGFIRQILGWREYMRGVYWAKMPEYAEMNHFDHSRSLPDFFWTGNTKMACMKHAIDQSLEYAYAHHIQRLMVTGNFALLAGIDPDEIDKWYLGIYIDAIQWVEITNTRGMSQYADGGIVGTKPYVSSGNYIKKMSHYCSNCHYDVNEKVGKKACPFNSLYWHFIDRHEEQLENNYRMSMMYRIWNNKEASERTAILEQGEEYLDQINKL